MRKKTKILLIVTVAVSICMGAGWWLARSYRPSYSPFALRRARWYVTAAPRFFKYCFVPLGTPKSTIIERFGKPELAGQSDSSKIKYYIRTQTSNGHNPPSTHLEGRVLIYEDYEGLDAISVYYYLDDADRLKATFISET